MSNSYAWSDKELKRDQTEFLSKAAYYKTDLTNNIVFSSTTASWMTASINSYVGVWTSWHLTHTCSRIYGSSHNSKCCHTSPSTLSQCSTGHNCALRWVEYIKESSKLPSVVSHGTVNPFVDPTTGICTQHVESYWNRTKI